MVLSDFHWVCLYLLKEAIYGDFEFNYWWSILGEYPSNRSLSEYSNWPLKCISDKKKMTSRELQQLKESYMVNMTSTQIYFMPSTQCRIFVKIEFIVIWTTFQFTYRENSRTPHMGSVIFQSILCRIMEKKLHIAAIYCESWKRNYTLQQYIAIYIVPFLPIQPLLQNGYGNKQFWGDT